MHTDELSNLHNMYTAIYLIDWSGILLLENNATKHYINNLATNQQCITIDAFISYIRISNGIEWSSYIKLFKNFKSNTPYISKNLNQNN